MSRSLIEAIIRGGASKDRKSKLLTSLTNLDIFEAALLHRIVQNLDGHEVDKTKINEQHNGASWKVVFNENPIWRFGDIFFILSENIVANSILECFHLYRQHIPNAKTFLSLKMLSKRIVVAQMVTWGPSSSPQTMIIVSLKVFFHWVDYYFRLSRIKIK